jgi:hypothetical protein
MVPHPQVDSYATRSTHAGTLAAGFGEGVCLSRSREAGLAYTPVPTNLIANGRTDRGLRGHCWASGPGAFGPIEDAENAKDRTTVSAGTASGGRTL